MDGRLTTVETNLTHAQDGIVALQSDVVRLKAANVTLHDQINAVDTATNADIAELRSDVVLLEAANVTLNARLEAAEATISELTALVRTLTQTPTSSPSQSPTLSPTTSDPTVSPTSAYPTVPPTQTPTSSPTSRKRIVFVTSETYTGSLGGILGADLKCQDLAGKAGVSGTFKAWLSSSTSWPAKDFVKSDVPYVMTNGIQVANDWQDLTDFNLDNAITFDEGGVSIEFSYVWTGTDEYGFPDSNGGRTFCSDWTSTSSSAVIGFSGFSFGAWTDVGALYSDELCDNANRLYCFEQ